MDLSVYGRVGRAEDGFVYHDDELVVLVFVDGNNRCRIAAGEIERKGAAELNFRNEIVIGDHGVLRGSGGRTCHVARLCSFCCAVDHARRLVGVSSRRALRGCCSGAVCLEGSCLIGARGHVFVDYQRVVRGGVAGESEILTFGCVGENGGVDGDRVGSDGDQINFVCRTLDRQVAHEVDGGTFGMIDCRVAVYHEAAVVRAAELVEVAAVGRLEFFCGRVFAGLILAVGREGNLVIGIVDLGKEHVAVREVLEEFVDALRGDVERENFVGLVEVDAARRGGVGASAVCNEQSARGVAGRNDREGDRRDLVVPGELRVFVARLMVSRLLVVALRLVGEGAAGFRDGCGLGSVRLRAVDCDRVACADRDRAAVRLGFDGIIRDGENFIVERNFVASHAVDSFELDFGARDFNSFGKFHEFYSVGRGAAFRRGNVDPSTGGCRAVRGVCAAGIEDEGRGVVRRFRLEADAVTVAVGADELISVECVARCGRSGELELGVFGRCAADSRRKDRDRLFLRVDGEESFILVFAARIERGTGEGESLCRGIISDHVAFVSVASRCRCAVTGVDCAGRRVDVRCRVLLTGGGFRDLAVCLQSDGVGHGQRVGLVVARSKRECGVGCLNRIEEVGTNRDGVGGVGAGGSRDCDAGRNVVVGDGRRRRVRDESDVAREREFDAARRMINQVVVVRFEAGSGCARAFVGVDGAFGQGCGFFGAGDGRNARIARSQGETRDCAGGRVSRRVESIAGLTVSELDFFAFHRCGQIECSAVEGDLLRAVSVCRADVNLACRVSREDEVAHS